LNLDDADFRILGRGDYIDAVNVTRDSPGEGQDTVVSNNIGNVLIPYTLPSGTNKVIGSREDKKRNRLYYCVWNSTKKHSILYYDANKKYVVKVLENMTDTGQVDILEILKEICCFLAMEIPTPNASMFLHLTRYGLSKKYL
jgi:hypothetical protein